MQPLAIAEDVLSSREIEASIFHGRSSPYDPINLARPIKDMAFINAIGFAPSTGPIRPNDRQPARPSRLRSASRATGRDGSTFRVSALNPERRPPVSAWKSIVASPSAGPLAGRAATTDHRPAGREGDIVAGPGTDGHRHL
jgi:hypothetical protein